jgi:hypothetical protein
MTKGGLRGRLSPNAGLLTKTFGKSIPDLDLSKPLLRFGAFYEQHKMPELWACKLENFGEL